VDPCGVEVGHGGAMGGAMVIGDMLRDALVWSGRVVVRLILHEDRVQVCRAEDQDPVEEFAAQGADEALADRVHARRLDGGAQDGGAGGLEYGVEGAGEVRSAVADQAPDVLDALVEPEGEVASLLHGPVGLDYSIRPGWCRLPGWDHR